MGRVDYCTADDTVLSEDVAFLVFSVAAIHDMQFLDWKFGVYNDLFYSFFLLKFVEFSFRISRLSDKVCIYYENHSNSITFC